MSIKLRDQQQDEKGVALLLALFALILISAVGVAIVFMSTGETSIAANQRSSVTAWEAAKGGLEEARSRMSKGDVNYIGDANRPLDKSRILYLVNPNGAGDPVQPSTASNRYFDTQYKDEWGLPIDTGGLTVTTLNSDMQALLTGGTINAAPPYKWVRVTAKTARSANQDISGAATTPLDNAIPVYYNGSRQNLTSAGVQVFVLTSRAVLPNGTRKTLREEVAPDIPFPITAAVNTALAQDWGAGWTGSGNPDPGPPSCSAALVGVNSATNTFSSEVFSGNVSGTPSVTSSTPLTRAQVTQWVQKLSPFAQPIDNGVPPAPAPPPIPPFPAGVTGVQKTSATPTYAGPQAVLGAPTAPKWYYAPGNLTLGTAGAGNPLTGGGVLLVDGDLWVDVTNGFSYSGLIIATKDIKFYTSSPTSVSFKFQGAIIAGMNFDAPPANLSGGIQIQANPCLVNDMFAMRPWHVLAFREITD